MSLLMLSAAFLASQAEPAAAPAQPAENPEGQRVVVTGDRPERDVRGAVEGPYSESERVTLGSRVGRRHRERPFENVASETGVAGLLSATGLDFDGAGGAVARFRNRRVVECRALHEQVSQEIACILLRAKQHTEAGDFAAARGALTPLLARHGLTAWERYYAGYYAYGLADAQRDDAGREQALHMMLATGRMEEADRRRAIAALPRSRCAAATMRPRSPASNGSSRRGADAKISPIWPRSMRAPAGSIRRAPGWPKRSRSSARPAKPRPPAGRRSSSNRTERPFPAEMMPSAAPSGRR